MSQDGVGDEVALLEIVENLYGLMMKPGAEIIGQLAY